MRTPVAGPAFSVLLSAHNEERYVGSAIESVLGQTRPDFELIVVDDGSTDATAEAVARYVRDPRVRLLRQANAGLAPSLNRAAAAGSAPYLALIDADDLWFPRFLEEMGAALDRESGAAFAFTDAWWLDELRGRFYRRSISEYLGAPAQVPADPRELLLALLEANWIFGLTAMRRRAFEAVGGFRDSLAASEDYELWLRFLAHGWRAVRVPGRLAVQRDRGGSMSKDRAAMFASLREVHTIVAEELPVAEEVRARARGRAQTMDRNIAALRSGRGATVLRWRLRGGLGRARKAVGRRWIWHRAVPGEVEAAFPGRRWGPPEA